MKRRTFDVLASVVGLGLAALLIVAGSLLTWAHNFITDEVHNQLVAQKVFFPPSSDPELKDPAFAPVRQYAGQQLVTGQQAEVYADYFIANHLKAIGGGKTYAELPQDDPKRQQVMTASFLRASLYTSVLAFGVAALVAGLGVVLGLIGWALMKVGRLGAYPRS